MQSSIDTRITTENNHSILVIPKLLKKDTGAYTCRAENVYGSVMCTASINILPDWEIAEDFSSPTFVITPETAKVMDGQPATFICKVSYYVKLYTIHCCFNHFLCILLTYTPSKLINLRTICLFKI